MVYSNMEYTALVRLIYLTTIWNIDGMVHFINTDNTFNLYVDRNNISNIPFTRSDFN